MFATLHRLSAAERGKVKITGIRMMPIARLAHTLIRIDTDAGISGYGEAGSNGPLARAWLLPYQPVLLGQDPLAIETHFHRMSTQIHPYMAHIPTLSGIDMALWDLAGRLLNLPVYSLLDRATERTRARCGPQPGCRAEVPGAGGHRLGSGVSVAARRRKIQVICRDGPSCLCRPCGPG